MHKSPTFVQFYAMVVQFYAAFLQFYAMVVQFYAVVVQFYATFLQFYAMVVQFYATFVQRFSGYGGNTGGKGFARALVFSPQCPHTNGMDCEILPPTDDWIFKLLFGDERHKSILVDLLKAFIDLPDEEYELTFLDTYLKPEFEDDKLGIVDVKVQTKTGKIIDIEIQVCPVKNIGKRLSFYKSKLIVGQIDKSEGYEVIQKVICICISNYDLFPGVKDYLNQFRFSNRRNNLCFEDIPEEVFTIELPKVPHTDDGSPLWDWTQFLRSRTKEEFEMIAAKNPEIRKAVDTLYELSADPAVRAEYEYHEKARRDWINGINGARLEGRIEGAQRVVDLIQSGKTPEEAMRILGTDPV